MTDLDRTSGPPNNAEGTDLIDCAFSHVFASERAISRTLGKHLSLLQSAFSKKMEKYAALLTEHIAGRIVSLIECTTGGWDPRSYDYQRIIAFEAAEQSDTPTSLFTTGFFRQLSAQTIANVADSLTIDPH